MNGWHGGRTDEQTDGRKTVIGEAEDKYKIRSKHKFAIGHFSAALVQK